MDGHLKLWKKQEAGIEFVKHYRAHLTPVVSVSASADGQLFASVSEDGSAKVFDVVNFGGIPPLPIPSFLLTLMLTDMINIIKLGYTPHACCWVHRRGQAQGLLAVFVLPTVLLQHSFSCSVQLRRGVRKNKAIRWTGWGYSSGDD